jgi:multiple sugar transport system substrate-binding protein
MTPARAHQFPSQPQLSRRRFLHTALLAATAAMGSGLIAACSSAQPAGQPGANAPAAGQAPGGPAAAASPAAQTTAVAPASGAAGKTLTVGVYAYVPQGIPFDQVAKTYADAHGVTVNVAPIGNDITRDSAAFVQRMAADAQSKHSTYDLIAGPTTWIEVAPLAKLGAIEPIEQYVPKTLLDDMYDPVKKGVTFADGKIYSMPWWADVVGLMYRKSMLQDGLGTDTPPATWDELVNDCETLKTKLAGKSAYGADWNQGHRLYLPVVSTLTNNVYTSDGLWNVDDPAYLQGLQMIHKLYPYMPASSQQDLGSSQAFQAGQVAMATYWPTQVLRAIQAGQPKDDILMVSNPKSTKPGTLFWNADVIIPKYSSNKEEAGRFMNEALLSDFTVQKTYENWKLLPYKSINEKHQSTLPDWAKPLVAELSSGQPLPMNPYFLGFEQPVFKEEVEKMILQNQSAEQTQKNLSSRFKSSLQDFKS